MQVLEDDPVKNANAEMFDQLEKKFAWWILESTSRIVRGIGIKDSSERPYFLEAPEGLDVSVCFFPYSWNRGRPRETQDPNPLFHLSVKLRKNYTSRAKLPPGAKVEYVD